MKNKTSVTPKPGECLQEERLFYEEMSSTPEPSPVVKARMHRANKFSRMRKPSRGLTETLKAQARKRKRRR